MNRIDFDSVYKDILELEGLLLLIKERGDEAPAELLSHFKERLSMLCGLLDDLNGDSHIDMEEDSGAVVGSIGVQDTAMPDGGCIADSVSHIMEMDDSTIPSEHFDGQESSREADASDILEEPITESDEARIASNAEFEENEDADITEREGIRSESPAVSEIFRVGDMLQHQNQHDLRRSFTLNDRFRFRRELFGNNDNEFADALNLVSAMSSSSEAEEYFYEDLGWDASNEEVKEFMSIISRHFNGRR